jgi:Uma2 family endonuclease
MNLIPAPVSSGEIVYPERDGKPMSDNTRQFRWIVTLAGNLAALFRDRPDVFVAGDLLWYPVEGHPEIRLAPDVLVVFGRPRGDRGSYQQWLEDNIPPQVVFKVLSPGNSGEEMIDKHAFCEEHGVEEYCIYNPDSNRLHVYLRRGEVLVRVRQVSGFVSPRLGIRFDLSGEEMVVYGPDGRRFLTFEELQAEREREQQQRQLAEQRAEEAVQQAQQAAQRAEEAERRAARAIELGRKARLGQASGAELQELEHLEREFLPPS